MLTPDQLAGIRTAAAVPCDGATPQVQQLRSMAMSMLDHIDAQAARIAELERAVVDEREACAATAEAQADEYGGQDYYATGCLAAAASIRARGQSTGSRRMTGQEAIDLAGQITQTCYLWGRPNSATRWAMIQLQPWNARGIEYGMRSWEFVGPIYPPADA
ncbi:hypothetical protein [Chromobacterium violaceum]|uniref:hypothetical protein n=1 Tax=Chromobacterium violaceum TaxID=536 RepID=UPI00143D012A|nr:hypothetical protein [Chromobacterium violaceum]QIY81464.1 hypothetical protein FOB43_20835 [Chromobacterium violaceum]